MFFKKDSKINNETIIHTTNPNFIFSMKKALLAFILLAFILGSTSSIIQYIGNLQIYLIDRFNLPLTSYAVSVLVIIVLILIFYIIWQLVTWYSTEYTLTDQRIIIKKGVFFTKKNYMPYNTIQDITTIQSILGRIFSIGSISLYSAYDNNQLSLKNITKPDEVEEIIFNNMKKINYQRNNYPHEENLNYGENFPPYENGEFYPYDNYNREEYYPQDNFQEEFYNKDIFENEDINQIGDRDFESTIDKAINNLDGNIKFKPNDTHYYKENYPSSKENIVDSYSKDFYKENEAIDNDYSSEKEYENDKKDKDSEKDILKRHSRKFKQ